MILAPRYLPRLTATVGLFTRYGLDRIDQDKLAYYQLLDEFF